MNTYIITFTHLQPNNDIEVSSIDCYADSKTEARNLFKGYVESKKINLYRENFNIILRNEYTCEVSADGIKTKKFKTQNAGMRYWCKLGEAGYKNVRFSNL